MYSLLIRLMVLSALVQLGISASDFMSCTSLQCVKRVERASRDVLRIEWKPLSVFPEEAKRFK